MLHPALIPPPPGRCPPFIWWNARRYYAVPETAARWQCSEQNVRKWARRHAEHCREHNGHAYIWEEIRP